MATPPSRPFTEVELEAAGPKAEAPAASGKTLMPTVIAAVIVKVHESLLSIALRYILDASRQQRVQLSAKLLIASTDG
jgi:hypothetical protein